MIAVNTSESITKLDPYLEQFKRFENEAGQPPWLVSIRRAGFARFSEMGYPTSQQEDWRFTNIAPLAKLPFHPVFKSDADGLTSEMVRRFGFANLPGSKLVFVNGHYSRELSTISPLPDGVMAGSLATALAADRGLIERHLTRYVPVDANAFAALNAAFFKDGAFIHVPAGRTVSDPIQLVFISTSSESVATIHPRNLIVAEPDSRLTVVETYASASNAACVTNAVTELLAGDGAVVEHLKFQNEGRGAFHVATIHGQFGGASRVNLHSFALGARLSRNNIRATLAGEGLECVLNGLYLTRGEQIADHHMIVEHAQPRCASHEYFNGILDDKSKGVFHGRILVQPVAQKTDAKQTNKNLLLSDEATVDTKPQLEIYADDVKCTHGATIGQMNEQSIFYLRARGIGLEKARQMLMHAFAGEIIDRVKCEPVREALDKLVWDRLEENPSIAEKK